MTSNKTAWILASPSVQPSPARPQTSPRPLSSKVQALWWVPFACYENLRPRGRCQLACLGMSGVVDLGGHEAVVVLRRNFLRDRNLGGDQWVREPFPHFWANPRWPSWVYDCMCYWFPNGHCCLFWFVLHGHFFGFDCTSFVVLPVLSLFYCNFFPFYWFVCTW